MVFFAQCTFIFPIGQEKEKFSENNQGFVEDNQLVFSFPQGWLSSNCFWKQNNFFSNSFFMSTNFPASPLILTEVKNRVGLLTMNRPDKKNALNQALLSSLVQQFQAWEKEPEVAVVVLTGGEKIFAAGADIQEMAEKSFVLAYQTDFLKAWDEISHFSKPIIAAVCGLALGGGMELAMLCDILLASNTAVFGQPEVHLGITPGAGGTQRLLRAVGKSKAMEICLTGERIPAKEALKWGLVSQVYEEEDCLAQALQMAEKIAKFSLPVLQMIKEEINQGYEMNLSEAIRFERRLFQACFSLEDQTEGMQAFLNKRQAHFQHR